MRVYLSIKQKRERSESTSVEKEIVISKTIKTIAEFAELLQEFDKQTCKEMIDEE